jgi:hypothetical protein
MKTFSFVAVVAIGIGLAACATAAPTEAPVAEMPTIVPATVAVPTARPLPTEAAEAITFTIDADVLGQLQNLEYTIDGTSYTLTDGSYADPAQQVTIDLFPPAAVGDLDGDGVDDAAVLLAMSGGGSGTFVYLAAVVDQGGTLVNSDTILLEDRVKVGDMTIADGVIGLDVIAHGPDDPMCCPTQVATWTYVLEAGKLALTSEAGPMTSAAP